MSKMSEAISSWRTQTEHPKVAFILAEVLGEVQIAFRSWVSSIVPSII